jgi:hypothetical protein
MMVPRDDSRDSRDSVEPMSPELKMGDPNRELGELSANSEQFRWDNSIDHVAGVQYPAASRPPQIQAEVGLTATRVKSFRCAVDPGDSHVCLEKSNEVSDDDARADGES